MNVFQSPTRKKPPAPWTVVRRSGPGIGLVFVLVPQGDSSSPIPTAEIGQVSHAESASTDYTQPGDFPQSYGEIWTKLVNENSRADYPNEFAANQMYEFSLVVDPRLDNEACEEQPGSDNQIGAFLDSVYSLAKQGKEDHAIDVIFEYVNSLLVQREFKSCDELLAEVNIEKIPPVLMVSFLTITAAAKPKLKNRDRFFKLVWGMVARQRGQDAADRLLDGLD